MPHPLLPASVSGAPRAPLAPARIAPRPRGPERRRHPSLVHLSGLDRHLTAPLGASPEQPVWLSAARPLAAARFNTERELQWSCEEHLEALLGIRVLASEYAAGPERRIDTLGLDPQGRPTIIEYKRCSSDTLINQAVDYHAWLEQHLDEVQALAQAHGWAFTPEVRVICVAHRFCRQDQALAQWLPFVEQYEYHLYGSALILSPVGPWCSLPVSSEPPAPTLRELGQGYAPEGLGQASWAAPVTRAIEARFEDRRLPRGAAVKQGQPSWYDLHGDGLDRVLNNRLSVQQHFLELHDRLTHLGLETRLRKMHLEYGCPWASKKLTVHSDISAGSLRIRLPGPVELLQQVAGERGADWSAASCAQSGLQLAVRDPDSLSGALLTITRWIHSEGARCSGRPERREAQP